MGISNLTSAAVLVTAIAAGGMGWQAASWECDAEKKVALERAIEESNKLAEQDREILFASAKAETKIKTIYRNIVVEVDKYVDAHAGSVDCLDAGGLQLWNHANSASAPAAATPDGTLPGASASAERNGDGAAAEPHHSGGDVRAVP